MLNIYKSLIMSLCMRNVNISRLSTI